MSDSTPALVIITVCGLTCLLPLLTLFLGVWIGRTRVSVSIEPRHRPAQPERAAGERPYAIRDQ